VTSIGNYAFKFCNYLSTVSIFSIKVTLKSNTFEGCNNLCSFIFEGDRNIAQNVQLPTVTNVFVTKTYKDKLFGGRPVIRLGLDNTEIANPQTESSIYFYILIGVLSITVIVIIIYFLIKYPRNKESKSGDMLKTAIII